MAKTTINRDNCALAKSHNIAISTKHSVELSNYLRYRSVNFAKEFLEAVIAKRQAVPFRRFRRDMGHKPGHMAAGRYPQKAAGEFLRLVKNAQANAQSIGLNVSSLKIVKLLANKASIPFTGARRRQGTKRTHLEIMVQEMKTSKKAAAKQGEARGKAPAQLAKQEVPTPAPIPFPVAKPKQEAPVEIKAQEVPEPQAEGSLVEESKEAESVEEEPAHEEPVQDSAEPQTKKEKFPAEETKEKEESPAPQEKEVESAPEEPTSADQKEAKAPEPDPEPQPEPKPEPQPEPQPEPTPKPEPTPTLTPVLKEESPAQSAKPLEEEISTEQKIAKMVSQQQKHDTGEDKKEWADALVEEAKGAPAAKIIPGSSPEELLEQAQVRAAQLNKAQKEDQSVDEVSGLYEQLKQKGTLRKEK